MENNTTKTVNPTVTPELKVRESDDIKRDTPVFEKEKPAKLPFKTKLIIAGAILGLGGAGAIVLTGQVEKLTSKGSEIIAATPFLNVENSGEELPQELAIKMPGGYEDALPVVNPEVQQVTVEPEIAEEQWAAGDDGIDLFTEKPDSNASDYAAILPPEELPAIDASDEPIIIQDTDSSQKSLLSLTEPTGEELTQIAVASAVKEVEQRTAKTLEGILIEKKILSERIVLLSSVSQEQTKAATVSAEMQHKAARELRYLAAELAVLNAELKALNANSSSTTKAEVRQPAKKKAQRTTTKKYKKAKPSVKKAQWSARLIGIDNWGGERFAQIEYKGVIHLLAKNETLGDWTVIRIENSKVTIFNRKENVKGELYED